MCFRLGSVRFAVVLGVVMAAAGAGLCDDDPYETYILTSTDFQSVPQEKDWLYEAFPSWTYMPWTWRWTIGYTPASGQWSLDNGYNGAFLDWGRTVVDSVDKLAWIDQFGLQFYMDHTAAKRYLHMWDGNESYPVADVIGTGVRTEPVNDEMRATLEDYISTHIGNVVSSPNRGAYALDDEISWGHFVKPCMWQVTDEAGAYDAWLDEIYGGAPPTHAGWISYEDLRTSLPGWSVGSFDAGPLMDQWTFNDSYWLNFVGDLVAYANSIDPNTPCGFVGGQTPNAFGGYDYAKIMHKVQYLESYNLGGSNSLIRSFNPNNAVPTVLTHFHSSVQKTVWETWYYLAHGNRGHIGWVDTNWFPGGVPAAWHAQTAPARLEAGDKVGPLLARSTWKHDGVAILYNHASIQLSWILDAEAHGATWPNRNGDHIRGSSHLVRRAWENMLRDEGLQYNFIAYDDLIRNGLSDEYKVLILPAAIALSDAEARRIREFCAAGGTVIADYMPGLWDQHGKGRPGGGALDDLFGVAHDPDMTAADVFGTSLWCEVDQDINYYYSDFDTFMTNANSCILDPSGFHKAVRDMGVMHVSSYGAGTAVLMNLSPQYYNAYRLHGYADAADRRATFMGYLHDAGLDRWVEIENAGPATHGYEITCFETEDGRTIVMLCLNPEDIVSSATTGLRSNTVPVTLKFDTPIMDARDERAETALGDGLRRFNFDWTLNEAVVMSFAGEPIEYGDANCDRLVNVGDLAILAGHWQQAVGDWSAADFNDDGIVNAGDLALLAAHWQGASAGGCPPAPEPGVLALLALAAAALLARRRK